MFIYIDNVIHFILCIYLYAFQCVLKHQYRILLLKSYYMESRPASLVNDFRQTNRFSFNCPPPLK